MTEIPDHLLQRSRERREALGLSTGETPATGAPAPETSAAVEPAGAAASPAPARPAAPAPAPAPPPPPKPDPPYVAAARSRKRIPWWAMPVVAGLPVWAAIYAFTLEPPSAGEGDPLAQGEELYTTNGCGGCHGASGGGGVGPGFTNGDIVATFPEFRGHVAWVLGGAESAGPDGSYGDPARAGGPRNINDFDGVMPAFPDLTDDEVALIVRYEREVLGGAEPEPELVAITEGEAEPDFGESAGG
jgi:mono/diheme cytochrome c family protein